MAAFAQIPLQSSALCFGLRSNQTFPSSRINYVGVPGFPSTRLCSWKGSASSFEHSNQEDGPVEPEQAAAQNEGKEWLVNGEKSAKDELYITESLLPIKGVLHWLRRGAQLKSMIEELKYNSSMKPHTRQQCADFEVHERDARVPSWAVTALTMAVAFAAGVALAQCRGGLFPRNKAGLCLGFMEPHVLVFESNTWITAKAVVDSRVSPAGTASVSYPEQFLGHFRAEEAPESDIKAVLADGSVGLRTTAADAFLRMQGEARSEGVWLVPISGFRTVRQQQATFFGVKAERRQSAPERAKTSAPPGYSEHHTGYAIDIGDATDPATCLRQEFENGAAFRWLQQNAARFHFELSFPKDNWQGIMFEPWHWRFVGDDHSLHTFYAQHKVSKSLAGCKP